ncbi:hypothetical protein DFH27DRAFT_486300, partial [Peziza echinospora]
HPLIDHHAHNILREPQKDIESDFPFELIVSEASGIALTEHSTTTLAHHRSIRQLSAFYGCPATLEDIKKARQDRVEADHEGLVRELLQGTSIVLMDDGLANEDDVLLPLKSNSKFIPSTEAGTSSRVQRIVRIKSEMERIVKAVKDLALANIKVSNVTLI